MAAAPKAGKKAGKYQSIEALLIAVCVSELCLLTVSWLPSSRQEESPRGCRCCSRIKEVEAEKKVPPRGRGGGVLI